MEYVFLVCAWHYAVCYPTFLKCFMSINPPDNFMSQVLLSEILIDWISKNSSTEIYLIKKTKS